MTGLTRQDYTVENPARFSVEEFQQLVDTGVFAGSQVELVEGVPIRMSPASPHQMTLQRELAFDLYDIFGRGLRGYVAQTEATIRFAQRTLRDIDIAVIERFDPEGPYPGPEKVLLAIEISVTTQHYDLNDKREEYARAGIPHYWVVDVPAKRVHLMSRPLDGDYTERRPADFGEEIAVPGSDKTVRIGEPA
jgi:Uma2 family endonuclease